jgi:hypothetical protein
MSAGIARIRGNPACHVVQFYGNDNELIEHVVGYLADGIDDGEVVLVVATDAHRQAFDASLTARGVDVAEAAATGSYVVIDAETAMRKFLVSDQPDPVGFESTIGPVIRQALRTGRPVRAYSDIVARLWDAGHVTAAIELEALWNALASQLSFSLFCAYPTQTVAGADHLDAFTEVRRLHSAVVDQPAAALADGQVPDKHCQDSWITII